MSANNDEGVMIILSSPSGAGKTTLIKLLFRFYELNAGTIMFDQKNINDINIESLRSKIGLVNQEIFLFDGSIQENICYPNYEFDQQHY